MNWVKSAAENADGVHAGRGVTGGCEEPAGNAMFLMRVFK